MRILLKSQQVTLNDLHVMAIVSADHYDDASDFVDDEHLARLFAEVSQRRRELVSRVERKVRESGALPAMPDADREDGEQILSRLTTLISDSQPRQVLEQRLKGERRLLEALQDLPSEDLEAHQATLLEDFIADVERVISRLESMRGAS
jgi:hypothetical protein